MIYVQALLMFIFSIGNDWVSIKWHEARENKRPVSGAIYAFVLGVIAWLAFLWVVQDSVWLIIPDLLGTVIGSYYGIKYHHAPLPIAIWLGFKDNKEKD